MRLRYATEDDIRQKFGGMIPYNVRAVVVEHDGKVVGSAGIFWGEGYPFLWSDISDELRPHKMVMCRAATKIRAMLREHKTVQALRNTDEPTSARLLSWLGFELVAAGDAELWQRRETR